MPEYYSLLYILIHTVTCVVQISKRGLRAGMVTFGCRGPKICGFLIILLNTLTVLVGDYNGTRIVDAAGYVVWRDNLGGTTILPNETTPGAVTQEDYLVWKTNFGMTAVSTGSLSGAVVPEPSSLLQMMGLAVVGICGRHRLAR